MGKALLDTMVGWMKIAICTLIRFYQLCISPLKPRCCRFEPSCSEYARQAVMLHGPFKGLALAAWRIARCHPFYRGELYDPVPPRKSKNK